MKKRTIAILSTVIVVVIVAVVAIVAGNSHKSTPMDMGMQSATSTNQVSIKNYMFTPMAITVKVGTTVTWTNTDSVNHTITADNNSTDAPNSMDIGKGKSYDFTFKKAGTYTYHCFPHPYMHGTVTVTN